MHICDASAGCREHETRVSSSLLIDVQRAQPAGAGSFAWSAVACPKAVMKGSPGHVLVLHRAEVIMPITPVKLHTHVQHSSKQIIAAAATSPMTHDVESIISPFTFTTRLIPQVQQQPGPCPCPSLAIRPRVVAPPHQPEKASIACSARACTTCTSGVCQAPR
jgi:hypothetical protein